MSVSPVYCAVFDIDDVLAFTDYVTPEVVDFIEREGAVVQAIVPHYVLPGVREFIQLLYRMEDVQVWFFSSGDKTRNHPFVRELLGEEVYEELRSRILSRDDLREVKARGAPTEYKKDLHAVMLNIANTILIDDNIHNAAGGQAENFLRAGCVDGNAFTLSNWKRNAYGADGMRFIKIRFDTRSFLRSWPTSVKAGNCIKVIMAGFWDGHHQFRIAFVDQKTHECREMLVEDSELRDVFYQYYHYNQEKYPQWVEDKIRSMVENQGGRTRKIWRRPNRIFCVAGLFFTALDNAKREHISLSESLSRLYLKEAGTDSCYTDAVRRMLRHDELYWKGLKLLQAINPALQFTSPQNYPGFQRT